MSRLYRTAHQFISDHPLVTAGSVAVVVRILFVLLFPSTFTATGDFHLHDALAQLFANGEGFGSIQRIQPGYPAVLGILYAVFGTSISSIIVLQIGLGALVAVGAYRLADYIFDDRRVSFWVGIVSAVWPTLVITAVQYGTGTLLYTTLLLFGAYYLLKCVREKDTFSAVLSGLLFVFAIWTDVIALFLPLILLIVIVWYLGKTQSTSFSRLTAPTIFLLVMVCGLGVWVYRNHVVFHPTVQPDKTVERFLNFQPGKKTTVVAKDAERQLFTASFWEEAYQKRSSVGYGIYQLFAFPHNLNVLSQRGSPSYKQAVSKILSGNDPPPDFRWDVLLTKVLITLLHWLLLVGGIWGVWKARHKPASAVVFAILLYTTVAVVGYGITRGEPYLANAGISRFIFPMTPLFIIFAIPVIRQYIVRLQKSVFR